MFAEKIDLVQGSHEWLAFRKTKITATDAPVIMGVSPWKTKRQLYYEKLSDDNGSTFKSKRMQRGIDLEPLARDLFILNHGYMCKPCVIVKDWAMASLDGMDESRQIIVEIKCPGENDHQLALQGIVPPHYFPQIQHQLYVCDVQLAYYFSFDGIDGVSVEVKRDEDYIQKMVDEELAFYECLMNKTPPEPSENDYLQKDDDEWFRCVSKWKNINEELKTLQKEEYDLRNQLILLSGGSNSKGAGISLCQVQRKGNVDYSKIPELKDVDIDKYRKDSTTNWRITEYTNDRHMHD